MIYLGPQAGTADHATLADDLPLSEVMARSAAEMAHVRDAVADLEWMVVSNPPLMQDPDVRKILQSIDPIQQALQAMSGFMTALAQEPCKGQTSVEKALDAVHLETLRNRLGAVI